ncbi:MAG: hypothetical protein DI533_17950 [Cereibacter sphaeroides]|uniref:MipA/OmpV family protein n=1 Tax=Cereibacter sphaeroides TaxID=1063 RepID=A0A2W5TYQ5_CERSP|nr:MAG: hypothetical protein DI533_17950 [Cereibacter sphaeroides]
MVLAFVALFATGAASIAQEEPAGIGLGLGFFSGERAYGDTDNVAVPLVDYEGKWFKISGLTADIKLPWISSERLSFALRANYTIGEGYKADDTEILTGMAERKGGLWAGAAMDWRPDFADFSLEWQSDISGDANGTRLRVEASRTFQWDRVMLTPRITGTWMDENAVEYYYGVTPAEATPTRPVYDGEATLNLEVGLRAAYMLRERQMIMLDIGLTRVGDGIKDSPITVDDTLTSIGMGYVFRF